VRCWSRLAPSASAWLQQMLAQALRFDHRAGTEPALMTERLGQMAWSLAGQSCCRWAV
jgi:hypothetical protein